MLHDAKKRVLPVVFLTVFIDMLGFGVLIPVIPQLLGNPESPFYLLPASVPLSTAYFLLGLLLASFPFAQFLAAPILGQLSDRYGRKKVLAISLTGTCVSHVLFAIGLLLANLPLLFLARLLDGFTGGNVSVAQASIADVTEPKDRAKSFGLIGAAFGLGFILGPFIGGKLSDPSVVPWFSASTPFWFAAILSAANVASVLVRFPETVANPRHGLAIKWHQAFTHLKRAFSLRELRVLFASVFAYSSGFGFFITFLGVFLVARFGFSQGDIGNYFAFVGLCIVVSQGFIVRALSGKVAEAKILRFSMVGTGLTILASVLAQAPWVLYLAAIPMSIANGLTIANSTSLVSRSAGAEIQGEILGINSSLQALSQLFAPLVAGGIASVISPAAPLYLAAAVCVGAGLSFSVLFRRTEKTAQT